jgi:hypothetical protein
MERLASLLVEKAEAAKALAREAFESWLAKAYEDALINK